jgi:3-methylcrotonyl-CoA carboxylase beta subunit
MVEKYEKESQPYYSTARLWDDGIIKPSSLRKTVGMSLIASLNNEIPETKPGVYRM